MMPNPYVSLEERLTRYHTGLTNARDVSDLQSRVILYGYTPTKLDDLLDLRQETFDAHLVQKTEYDEQHIATQAFNTAWDTAHASYMHLIKLGRILFKDDYGTFVRLGLNEDRKRTYSGWLTQARKFYASLLDNPEALAKYNLYNTPLAAINTALNLVTAVETANTLQGKETGDAQEATRRRDAQVEALDKAMSEFYGLAQLACEDAPQLLEMLEIVVETKE